MHTPQTHEGRGVYFDAALQIWATRGVSAKHEIMNLSENF